MISWREHFEAACNAGIPIIVTGLLGAGIGYLLFLVVS